MKNPIKSVLAALSVLTIATAAYASDTYVCRWSDWDNNESVARASAPSCWGQKTELDKKLCSDAGKMKIFDEDTECEERTHYDGDKTRESIDAA